MATSGFYPSYSVNLSHYCVLVCMYVRMMSITIFLCLKMKKSQREAVYGD